MPYTGSGNNIYIGPAYIYVFNAGGPLITTAARTDGTGPATPTALNLPRANESISLVPIVSNSTVGALDPTGSWVNLGWNKEGVNISFDSDEYVVKVDNVANEITSIMLGQSATMSCSFSESSMGVMAKLQGQKWDSALLTSSNTSGTATASSSTTLTTGLNLTANQYVGWVVNITSGAGSGQTRQITSHTTGAASVLTVAPAFSPTPAATCGFTITPQIVSIGDTTGSGTTHVAPIGPGGKYEFRTVAVEGTDDLGKVVRAVFWKARIKISGELAFQRSSELVIPVEFQMYSVPTLADVTKGFGQIGYIERQD